MQSSLYLDALSIPGADLGPMNPFPQLNPSASANAPMKFSSAIPEEDRKHFGYGRISSILPYPIQDGYNRERSMRSFRTVVLENEILRATFLPELGGRLWSLFHKATERELLYVNPVFQPTNIALRGAWFSGGVEWNMGMTGHHPFTCETLHTARLKDEAGNPVLRMYEWERLRGMLFQIDASLPAGSPVLLVRVRLVNTNPEEIPTYWWSNIAVPEAAGSRVIAPADWAMSFGYGEGLGRTSIPHDNEGVDITYPTNIASSNDYFFRIPDGKRPWIAALDHEGRGLFQTSTARLKGRKLFVWGVDRGGQHWQEFLSEAGHPYVEIQGGLGRTQAECVPMPGGADWSWVEAYGLLDADAAAVHGDDWTAAVNHVKEGIDEVVPAAILDDFLLQTAALADAPPEEILFSGSGWGALENLRRSSAGEPMLGTPGTPFAPETLGAGQRPWLTLLNTGCFPEPVESVENHSWMIDPVWRQLLEQAVHKNPQHYASWLHLGVFYYANGYPKEAKAAWEQSRALCPSVEALRNLAHLAAQEMRSEERLALMEEALTLAPGLRVLAVECLQAYRDEHQFARVVEIYSQLSPELQNDGRIQLILAQAYLHIDLAKVRIRLETPWDVVDLKEGDNALTDLWFAYHERKIMAEEGGDMDAIRARVRSEFIPPSYLEFRMRIPHHEVSAS